MHITLMPLCFVHVSKVPVPIVASILARGVLSLFYLAEIYPPPSSYGVRAFLRDICVNTPGSRDPDPVQGYRRGRP